MKSYVVATSQVLWVPLATHPCTDTLLGSPPDRGYSAQLQFEPLCGLFCWLLMLHTQVFEAGKRGAREAGSLEALLTLPSYTILSS